MLSVNIKYTDDATFYNIDDYVINTLRVPFISRDISYALNSDGLDIEISDNYDYEGNTFSDIESCKLYDGDHYFHGTVTSTQENVKERSKTITFFKNIHLLNTKKLNRANLASRVSDTTNTRLFNDEDVNGNNSTSLMWLIRVMFEHVGLNDPTNSLSSKIAITSKTPYTNILFSELKVDMDVTYCINQYTAIKSDSTATNSTYDVEQEITYFEFVDMICKLFGIYLRYDPTGYLLDIADEYQYTISDNAVFDYEKTFYQKELFVDNTEFGFKFRNERYDYSILTPQDLNDGWYSNEKNESTSNCYNNLVIGFEDRSNLGSIYELNEFIHYLTAEDPTYYGVVGDKIRHKTENDYQKEFITTRILTTTLFNVLKVTFVYGYETREAQIEQVEIL